MKTESEEIELLRGGSIVTSLASAFGSGLRETRLTTVLGYLIALRADEFCGIFGFSGKARSVSLETRHAADRSDILIVTSDGVGVVEAKVGIHNPFDQALKYPARWRLLLTEHQPTKREANRQNCRYLRWRDLVPLLDKFRKSNHAEIRFLSGDLKRYLEEHNMIPKTESVEIYARELNDEATVTLFLHGHIYGCDFKAGSRLPEALYFAPHFGKTISDEHAGIQYGITYLAKIEHVEVVESFADLCNVATKIRGKQWFKTHGHLLQPVRGWGWKKARRSFLFLGMPRLVFNPPVGKSSLQKGKGWLSRHFLSFDDLFAAWGKPPLS